MYAITIGVFDGVHKGHQYILDNTLELAQSLNLDPLVLMFRYPAEKILGTTFDGLILPSWRRKEICENLGFKVIVKDMEEVWGVSHDIYLNNLIDMGVRAIVCGEDFTFGKDALGDVNFLQSVGESKGLRVKILRDFKKDCTRISSSVIKKELKNGNIKVANEMLNRPWTLEGPVYEDKHVGFKLGFPTANINVLYKEQIIFPKYGVYLVRGKVQGRKGNLWGLMNVGIRPTIHEPNKEPKVEVYFLDFFGNLYNEYIILEVLDFLREEKKFEDKNQLVEAMVRDEDKARELIAKNYGNIKSIR